MNQRQVVLTITAIGFLLLVVNGVIPIDKDLLVVLFAGVVFGVGHISWYWFIILWDFGTRDKIDSYILKAVCGLLGELILVLLFVYVSASLDKILD